MTTDHAPAADHSRVMAALDISDYCPAVVRYGAWAAQQLAAPLELVHVEDGDGHVRTALPLTGEVDIEPRHVLLAQLQRERRKDGPPQTPGERLLQRACEFARDEYRIDVEPSLRSGDLARILKRDEAKVALYVIGKRGEYANIDSDHLGSQLEKVIRTVQRPLLVASRQFTAPKRVMIAFDGGPLTRRGVEAVATSALLRDLHVQVLMVGMGDAEQQRQLDWALDMLRNHGHSAAGIIKRGVAHSTILRETDAANIDLLVMGAYGRSRLRHIFIGSTTNHVLRTSRVPVLLLR
ncbi:MAG: universal stress protein [Pseudomonadota bacterium]|nr:universal stress protein [Pseudomonadota bacterium]